MTAKNWSSHFVKSNGIELHYLRTGGDDKPKLLMAHGFSDDGACWTPVAQKLEATFDIIMLDARGHGRSEAPAKGYGSADHAADIAGVIKALKLRKPLMLGHSMGALSAIATAATDPNLLGGIVLEDPPPWWVAQPKANPGMRNWIWSLKRQTHAEIVARILRDNSHWQKAEQNAWVASKQRMSFEAIQALSSAPFNWKTAARAITCRVLLIHGDAPRGGLITAASAAAFKKLVPQLEIAYIPDAGHSIRRDQFKPYMAAITRFLRAES